jgi:hypothetical protein
MLLVREVYSDWDSEQRGVISIHRADRAGAAPSVPDVDTMAKRYRVAGKILLSRLRTFLAFPQWFYLNLPVNTLTEPRPTPGSLATQFSSAGHYDLGEDQAMIVTVPAAAKETAPYQGIQLGSMWYISLDYINHQTSLTADQARADPDGRLRDQRAESAARGGPPDDLRRDGGHHRPARAAGTGRGRRRGGVPRLVHGARHYRPVPGRQQRRVPPLMTVVTGE